MFNEKLLKVWNRTRVSLRKLQKASLGTGLVVIPVKCKCGFMGGVIAKDMNKIYCPKCGENTSAI